MDCEDPDKPFLRCVGAEGSRKPGLDVGRAGLAAIVVVLHSAMRSTGRWTFETASYGAPRVRSRAYRRRDPAPRRWSR